MLDIVKIEKANQNDMEKCGASHSLGTHLFGRCPRNGVKKVTLPTLAEKKEPYPLAEVQKMSRLNVPIQPTPKNGAADG